MVSTVAPKRAARSLQLAARCIGVPFWEFVRYWARCVDPVPALYRLYCCLVMHGDARQRVTTVLPANCIHFGIGRLIPSNVPSPSAVEVFVIRRGKTPVDEPEWLGLPASPEGKNLKRRCGCDRRLHRVPDVDPPLDISGAVDDLSVVMPVGAPTFVALIERTVLEVDLLSGASTSE